MPNNTKKINNPGSVKAISYKLKANAGFTLMEIIVATAIFTIVSGAMMSLFNYTLKLNRRGEALRQASQGARNFAEFLAKEIRDSKVEYFIINGATTAEPVNDTCKTRGVGVPTYDARENRLALQNLNGETECIYLGFGNGAAPGHSYKDYVGTGVYTNNTDSGNGNYNPNPVIVLQKKGGTTEVLNPPNFRVENLMFLIRPACDPYTSTCPLPGGTTGYPKIQPSVTILMKFVVQLPTGEQYPIYYQTTVTTDDYNIPGTT